VERAWINVDGTRMAIGVECSGDFLGLNQLGIPIVPFGPIRP
jgi:hypothetical protein